ncbi:hypothetical protein ElyMa_006827800 [Elysia marginata]|uniref:Uncharacterized protein n=1 Tax=Elysia marginata TaxID=1093978 RepID=A0AAV4J883_9GAST|nr:hypothetical protein ElyMa_006827800 [Elysia marginata]
MSILPAQACTWRGHYSFVALAQIQHGGLTVNIYKPRLNRRIAGRKGMLLAVTRMFGAYWAITARLTVGNLQCQDSVHWTSGDLQQVNRLLCAKPYFHQCNFLSTLPVVTLTSSVPTPPPSALLQSSSMSFTRSLRETSEVVNISKYLGSTFSNNMFLEAKLNVRIGEASTTIARLSKIV